MIKMCVLIFKLSTGVHGAASFEHFEVRHPRCVSQITKYKVDSMKSKHNYILYSE